MKLTLVYSYYENPTMFKLQQDKWASYSSEIRKDVQIIVTDDCSGKFPIGSAILPSWKSFNLEVYRITKKLPWNWLEARNIGANKAKGEWLLLTDMDHLIREKIIRKILHKLPDLDKETVYQFNRVVAPMMISYKFHNDSFLVTKELFWGAGGYDEDYSGHYGTSGMFRRRLFAAAKEHKVFSNLSLVLYPREVVPDASTRDLQRKHGRDPNELTQITEWKKAEKRGIQHFLIPYERVI